MYKRYHPGHTLYDPMVFKINYMSRSILSAIIGLPLLVLAACGNEPAKETNVANSNIDTTDIAAQVITDTVFEDSDDPAIWINHANPAQSLIIGTDKHDINGGLYVFGLDGKIDRSRTVTGLKRMNNVDIAYGLKIADSTVDIAVATERGANSIRVFSLPAMKAIDGGGIPVFENETERDPMGIALYKDAVSSAIYAIVSRKSGPKDGYLFQYLLQDNGKGEVTAKLVRKFGQYSGKKEIESVAVDNQLGYVYYSDEQTGIRKYYAHPDSSAVELALFGQGEFSDDNEGISFYELTDSTGYILVSDQGRNRFNIYAREGAKGAPHQHKLIASFPVSAMESDGSETSSFKFPGYEGGLFVAMSTDKTFHFYSWKQIAERAKLETKKN